MSEELGGAFSRGATATLGQRGVVQAPVTAHREKTLHIPRRLPRGLSRLGMQIGTGRLAPFRRAIRQRWPLSAFETTTF